MNTLDKGIIISVAGVVLLVGIAFVVLAGAAFHTWKAAEREGNEAATQQNLKAIAAVEIQYYNTHSGTFGTFDQMIREAMLPSKFSRSPAAADGYVFTLSVTNQPSFYALNADPQSTATGQNHFYVDSNDSLIHFNPNRPASGDDPLRDK